MSAIDWDHWLRLGSVKEWEAAALSLKMNPHDMKRAQGATHFLSDKSFLNRGQKDRFYKRLREIEAYAEESDESLDAIELIRCGEWLSRNGANIPLEMGASARQRPDWRYWQLMTSIKGWEAAALSLDINPTSL